MNPSYDTEALASRPAWSVLLLILGVHFTLGALLQLANPAFGIFFDELFVFAGLTLLVVVGQNYRPIPFLALRPPPAKTFALALLAAVAGFFVAGSVNALNRWLVGPELASRYDVTGLFELESKGELALLVVGVSLLAPLGEELLFRGYLLRVLQARMGAAAAVLWTSAVFAVIHFNPASVLALFVLGVVFALLRLLTGSIWPAVLAHAVQNGTSSALVVSGLAADSPDELPVGQALALLVFTLPFLLLALRVLQGAPPDLEDDASLARDPAGDHRLRLSRMRRPLAIGAAAAALSLGAFAALRGGDAASRIRRFFGQDGVPAPSPLPEGQLPE